MLLDQPIVAKLAALSGEYFFFIGATWVALLYLHRRRWVASAAAFAAAVLWITYHLPVSLYLDSLSADSFVETRNFDLEEARFWFTTLDEAITGELSFKKLAAYAVFVGLETRLASNQRLGGSWDHASSTRTRCLRFRRWGTG